MILEFSITNFRSIREKQVFSMYASSARSKGDNIFEHQLSSGETVNLTKAAVIYGANASGKSNVVLALEALVDIITKTHKINTFEPVPSYNPFLFDEIAKNQACEFELIFLDDQKEKYYYIISFDKEEIIKEELYSYPKKHKRTIFTRANDNKKNDDENIHEANLGKELKNKQYYIHKKIPLLSIFGKAENYHKLLSPIYKYFKEIEVITPTVTSMIDVLREQLIVDYLLDDIKGDENKWLRERLIRLIRACDTQIQDIEINEELRKDRLFSKHKIFNNKKDTGEVFDLPFGQESIGTNRIFVLGSCILKALHKGSVIIFDELDSSLHPFVSRFLVKLFLNPISNPKNAQLIFTTHEPSILDKDLLRADQIWFTEKTAEGATELFSAQDFDGVREDVPFDKWYMAGKFGAVPHISEIEYIFGNGEKTTN